MAAVVAAMMVDVVGSVAVAGAETGAVEVAGGSEVEEEALTGVDVEAPSRSREPRKCLMIR